MPNSGQILRACFGVHPRAMVFPARNGRRQTRLHTLQHRTLCVRGKEPCPRGAQIRDGVVGEQV